MILGWVIQSILYLNVFILGAVITLAIQHFRAHRSSSSKSGPKESNPESALPPSVRNDLVSDARKQYQDAVARSAAELDKNLAQTTERLKQSLEKLRSNVAQNEQARYDEALAVIRDQAAGIVGGTAEEIAAHQSDLRQHFETHQAMLDNELQKEAVRTEMELQKKREDYNKKVAEFETQLLEHQKSLESSLVKREEALALTESQLESKLIELQKTYLTQQQEMEMKLQASIEARRQALIRKLENELADVILAFLSDALGSDIDISSQATSLTKLLEAHKDELLKGVR